MVRQGLLPGPRRGQERHRPPRSRRPTASSPSSSIPTPTPGTPTPRTDSRRSRPPTTSSGDEDKRSSYDQVREMGASGFGGFGPGGAGGPAAGRGPGALGARYVNVEDVGDLGDLFGGLFGGGGAGNAGPHDPPATRDRPRDRGPGLVRRRDDRNHGARSRSPGRPSATRATGRAPRPGPVRSRVPNATVAARSRSNQGFFSMAQPCRRCGATGRIVETPCPTCKGSGSRAALAPVPGQDPRRRQGRCPHQAGRPRRTRDRPGASRATCSCGYACSRTRVFGRKGDNLTLTLPVSFSEAALGRERAGPHAQRTRDAQGAGRHAQRQDLPHQGQGGAEARAGTGICWRPSRSTCRASSRRNRSSSCSSCTTSSRPRRVPAGRVVMRGGWPRNGPNQSKDDRAQAVYIISVAAELAGVHPQTLRIYERKGLVAPQRTSGNTRRYSDADIERLRAIQALTDEGVNLAGVKRDHGDAGGDGGAPAADGRAARAARAAAGDRDAGSPWRRDRAAAHGPAAPVAGRRSVTRIVGDRVTLRAFRDERARPPAREVVGRRRDGVHWGIPRSR